MASPVHPYSDYGVALRTLRSAKSWLGLLLLISIITQFIGFGFVYFTQQPYEQMTPRYSLNLDKARERLAPLMQYLMGADGSADQTAPEVSDFVQRTAEGGKLNIRPQWDATYRMAVPVTQMAGLIAASSQTLVIFITLLVVLVAQAPGVAQMTRSLIWAVLLLFMVLPWQYFATTFPIPGVLYGYTELLRMIGPMVTHDKSVYGYQYLLIYARFIVWPLATLLVLLIASERFRAGIMLAIGHPLQTMMQRPGATGVPAGLGAKAGAAKL